MLYKPKAFLYSVAGDNHCRLAGLHAASCSIRLSPEVCNKHKYRHLLVVNLTVHTNIIKINTMFDEMITIVLLNFAM